MNGFLLMSVPLFYLAVSSLMDDFRGKIDDSYKPLTYGMICFIPSVILYNIIRVFLITKTYTLQGIFFYYLFHDYLFSFGFSIISYLLVFGSKDILKDKNGLNRLFSFLCGFYSLWGVNDMIINFGAYNVNNALLLPIFRIITIGAFCLLFFLYQKSNGLTKRLFLLICFLLPFYTSFGSLLWRLSFFIPLLLATFLFPAILALLIYRLQKRLV